MAANVSASIYIIDELLCVLFRLCPSGSFMNGLGWDSRKTGHNRAPTPPDRIMGVNMPRVA
jgi:hypothetical protein